MARLAAREAYAALFEPRGIVIACVRCCRSAPWRGHEVALREGWRWRIGPKGLVWRCEECGGETKTEAVDGVV